ncbi:hypothetical protein [Streptomyces sp. HUAS TT20]|uniref:hypothetical protein n=1 Tax=Streptomyces sp. HUAS TT20 TaxID=3447509 RepID=UPI0021DA2584|nr:hypothetical protein N8I87_26530 [Streptomyces sp. HUAS 15-9]
MSDLGELDRPGTPSSPGAWDTRSEGWFAGEEPEPAPGDGRAQDSSRGAEPPATAGGGAARAGAVDPPSAGAPRTR